MNKRQVDEFNRLYPPGTPVFLNSELGKPRRYKIRAKAIMHSSGEPQIWLMGEWGSRNLSDIKPVQPKKQTYF